MSLSPEGDRVNVVIREERPSDDEYQEAERIVNIDQFIGRTVAEMQTQLARDPELNGASVADISIVNPNYRDTSYDPDLLDQGIAEEIDPQGIREVADDTVIEPLDYIRIMFTLPAATVSGIETSQIVQDENGDEDAAASNYGHHNIFTGPIESYKQWQERNSLSPGEEV